MSGRISSLDFTVVMPMLQRLNKPDEVKISLEPYDWLGHGMYFWGNNIERAMQWATDKFSRGKIKKPAVIGAVINLGYCCDFLDSKYIQMLTQYYELMCMSYETSASCATGFCEFIEG